MKQPPPTRASVPVERLRDAVRRAVQQSSSHEVGRALGLSAPAVRNFVAGAEPRPATLRKLTEWYVREAAVAHELDAETAVAALGLLLDGLPEQEREGAAVRVLETIRSVYVDGGSAVPTWAEE